MTIDEIRKDTAFWQRLLRLGGYNPGEIDGIRGKKTMAAEELWNNDAREYKRDFGEYDERTESNLATLIPEAQKAIRQWLGNAQSRAAMSGLTIKIIDGTRSYAEQDKLYNKKPRVTKAKGGFSWHNFGLAADFGVFCGKSYLTGDSDYKTFGAMARDVRNKSGKRILEWGGDWTSFVDYPHIQLMKFTTLAEARAKF